MQVVSQVDRETLVDAVKVIEKHRGKSMGFHKNKIVSFFPCVFGSSTPDWFQIRREIIDVELDGMMACGIIFKLIEIKGGWCKECHTLTKTVLFDTIFRSGLYKGPCDIKPLADMKLGPASRSFEFIDNLMTTVKVIRCKQHLDRPDRPLPGADIAWLQYEFRDLTLRASYHQP